MINFTTHIKTFFNKGQERTVKAKRNIAYSFFFKGISVIVNFLLVPLILGYLDKERYGIWLTLSSIIAWFSFFDLGLGNGMRNKFAEAVGKNDKKLARTYVSTTYIILGAIFTFLILSFLITNPFLNWQKILNTNIISSSELSQLATIIFVFFILKFYFKLIGTILVADQRPAINNAFDTLSGIISISIIYILTKTTEGSLIKLGGVLSIVPVLVLVFATVFFFCKDYKIYTPSFKYFDKTKAKNILGLGFKFFFLQIAAIIFYSSTNILIAQLTSQVEVTYYNISFKLFSIFTMINAIILTPIWSASTDAYSKGDYNWIIKTLRKLLIVAFILLSLSTITLIFSSNIIHLWLGDKIKIPFNLNLVIYIYIAIQLFTAPFSFIINGIGKLKISIVSIIIRLIIFFPLAIFLGNKYGVVGIISAMIIMQTFPLILYPIQVYLILNKKDYGLWSK